MINTDSQRLNAVKITNGSVLVLALWALVFLGALAIAVGAYVSSSIQIAREIKRRTVGHALALAGVEKAVMELLNDTNSWDGIIEDWSGNEDKFSGVEMPDGRFSLVVAGEPWLTNGFPEKLCYGLVDEERKININKANATLISWLIRIVAGTDETTAGGIAGAIKDWVDPDEEPGLTGGAENSYYRALDQSYSCHNGSFDSLYELLLVRGMTAEIFRRLAPHITVYGAGMVNLNTAGPEVLESIAALYGADANVRSSLPEKILKFRKDGNVFDNDSASAIVSQLNEFISLDTAEKSILGLMKRSTTVRSYCFRGVAVGILKGNAAVKVSSKLVVDSRIDFVYDRRNRAKVYWRMY
ncbi:MAG: general secretion pathway protein GspK [Lentisphaerae bacterium]|nr:general secretion pathway protein GspK [Lentisphaerota bacterium]